MKKIVCFRIPVLNLLFVHLIFLLSSPVCDPALAQEKPRVAILKPVINDQISKSVRKYLNLEKLQAEMEASFFATRKFEVVTRRAESLKAIRDEQRFAESELTAGNGAESGAIKNADYLIKPEVHHFSFYTSSKKVPHLQSKYFRTDHGTLEVDAQVLDTVTSQVTATFTLKSSFSTGEKMVNSGGGVPSAAHFSKLAKKVSAQMADQFLDSVFPVQVIKIAGDKVYLNRGQDGGLKNDMLLNVYTANDILIDPDTGEVLGTAEEYIGQIKVSRIKPRFTVATVVQSKQNNPITVGCIVRKVQ